MGSLPALNLGKIMSCIRMAKASLMYQNPENVCSSIFAENICYEDEGSLPTTKGRKTKLRDVAATAYRACDSAQHNHNQVITNRIAEAKAQPQSV